MTHWGTCRDCGVRTALDLYDRCALCADEKSAGVVRARAIAAIFVAAGAVLAVLHSIGVVF